jgi:hypothetical protein
MPKQNGSKLRFMGAGQPELGLKLKMRWSSFPAEVANQATASCNLKDFEHAKGGVGRQRLG